MERLSSELLNGRVNALENVSGPRSQDLYDEMQLAFGDGDRPDLRLPWYDRVALAACSNGPAAIAAYKRCLARAKTRNTPDRWFVAAVTRQFEENGWL